MNINFTFYTVKERKPERGEEIVWFRLYDTLGYEAFTFYPLRVEYSYEEVDKNGFRTGTGYCEPVNGTEECVVFDGEFAEPAFLWCPIKDFYEAVKEVI